MDYITYAVNTPTTTRVKISQNIDILPKVYVAFKSQTLSNLMCSMYIYRSKLVFDW